MFAYIKGILEVKARDFVVIDINGLGYKIFMSESAIDTLGNIGDIIKIHTFVRVKEDDISIFGFKSQDELRMFELLLSVGGVGAKTALGVLSNIEPSTFAYAVISEDVSILTQIPGIGPKSAKRIILELKDKLKTDAFSVNVETSNASIQKSLNTNLVEAISALQVLGYSKKDIDTALNKFDVSNLSIEDIIKTCLSFLAK